MSARIHFQSWPEPHVFDGEDLAVPCGEVLAKAVAVAMVDSEQGDVEFRSLFRGCHKCNDNIAKHRYYYAVVSGEESKQMEAKRGNG